MIDSLRAGVWRRCKPLFKKWVRVVLNRMSPAGAEDFLVDAVLEQSGRLPRGLEEFCATVLTRRLDGLPPADALRLLLQFGGRLGIMEDRMAIEYEGGLHPKHRLTRYHDFFIDRIRHGERVLDVGCGNGAVARDIAERAEADVLAVDIEPAQVRLAARMSAHPRVRYVVGDALRDLTAERFDVVVLSNVLEHLPERSAFLRRLQEQIQPSRILIRVPVLERDWRTPLRWELGLEWRSDLSHTTEYTLESFAEEVRTAGMHIRHQECRWGEIWAEVVSAPTSRARCRVPQLAYLHAGYPGRMPGQDAIWSGGAVKYLCLNRQWPCAGLSANILYGISSSCGLRANSIRAARQRGVRFVWNQNGVYVPHAYPPDVVRTGNQWMAEMMQEADHVLFQSEYCKRSADAFLGTRSERFEVLYNAISTQRFAPDPHGREPEGALVLLLCGSHEDFYRLDTALQTLAVLRITCPTVRLLIAGRVRHCTELRVLIKQLGLAANVDVLSPYRQEEAPAIYRRAHLLLHTKYCDPCPSVVLEAMACGLPVVYSATGGTPELVGEDAGIGIPGVEDYQQVHAPDPHAMAQAVLRVMAARRRYSDAARERAVQRFDLNTWQERHRQVFEELLR